MSRRTLGDQLRDLLAEDPLADTEAAIARGYTDALRESVVAREEDRPRRAPRTRRVYRYLSPAATRPEPVDEYWEPMERFL